MTTKHILVVDDEVGIRELLAEILSDEGYQMHLAENAEQARAYRDANEPDLVLLDIWMPDMDGVTLLKEWVTQDQLTMPVVMMSGHGTIETAVEATRIGAVDFLEKPISLQKLLNTVAHAIKDWGVNPHPFHVDESEQQLIVEIDGARQHFSLPLDLPLREAREHFDAAYFEFHMQKEAGNVSRVADKIGLERTHLYRKLKQLGIKFSKKHSNDQ